ncbi:SHOCT domain-containing protein [Thalassovita aquimarina]|uniref:SHOCT domain-containing protein n=1 Tax=Thalassovita aquimarina TaxID=2785917 RepID=A0ABS5HXA6_9RHOB|nr:SHOCT domain-containing protein [Thalassovita aquimarina]MBR9653603.1 SHOCT domain-containing protein [Thalassovita aquimarina]
MKRIISLIVFGLPALTATAALADVDGDWHGRYGHMMWGGGYGIFGGLMMLLFWAVIIVGIVFAVRWLSEGQKDGSRNDAMEILRQRLAKGEIDEDEYARRKKALED